MSDTNTFCVFCAIIRGQSPVAKVYENDTFLAFMDKYPITFGHTLVLPKYHYADLFKMTEAEVGNLYRMVHNIASAVYSATGAQPIPVGQTQETAKPQIRSYLTFMCT